MKAHMTKWTALAAVAAATAMLTGCPKSTSKPPATPKTSKPKGDNASDSAAVKARLPSAFRRSDPRAMLAPNAVKVELYVMSKCPFGTRVENTMAKLVKKLPEHLDLRVDYIATKSSSGLSSLRGADEVEGDKVELCAMKLYPLPRRFMPFLTCQNRDYRHVPHGWEACAREAKMNVDKIAACKASSRGERLLAKSLQRAKDSGARGSPTMVIAGKPHRGKRTEHTFMRLICDRMTGRKPRACRDLQPIKPLRVTVLNDKRCTHRSCKVDYQLRTLRRHFSKVIVTSVDYSSTAGKALYKTLGLKLLPAIALGPDADKSDGFDSYKRWLTANGKFHMVRVYNAKWDPTAEICDNGKDDTGNGKVDCADKTCHGKLVCRKLQRRHLTMFTRPHCPYCNRAIKKLAPTIKRIGKKMRFVVHFVARRGPGGKIVSMYGPADLEEMKRRLCASRMLGRRHSRRMRLLDYMVCRANNYRSSDWKPCARQSKLPVRRVERCADGNRGAKLLSRNIELALKLKLNGTPTWLINNRYKVSGGIARKVERALCKHNKKLPGCT